MYDGLLGTKGIQSQPKFFSGCKDAVMLMVSNKFYQHLNVTLVIIWSSFYGWLRIESDIHKNTYSQMTHKFFENCASYAW